MAKLAVLVALFGIFASCADAPAPEDALQTERPEFEVVLEVDARGAVRLDGAPLEHDLESPENYARLRSAGARRVGHYDANDPTSCILPLVRVRLSLDPEARLGRVCLLLWFANQLGVNLWDFVVAAPGDGGPYVPLPLQTCALLHGPALPWSPERRLIVRLIGSKKLEVRGLDPERGWGLENCDYGTPPDPRADLDWSQVQSLVAHARSQGCTTLLSRTVSSQTPWRDVLPLLGQLHELGVDHYEFWLGD
jgi:hypothetical protein